MKNTAFSLFTFITLFSFVLVISSSNSNAQPVNNQVGDVVMPPPNAAALGKYGDIPVSHSTGVPNISIPLCSVEEGDLKLGISANYHASGLKVGEMASWIGQGWSLNAGGMISRTIQGMPDEHVDGFWNKGATLPEIVESLDDWNLIREIGYGLKDGEPDIFSFNLSGYNGKFYINSNKEVVLVPKQDIKIEFEVIEGGGIDNYLKEFIITIPNGTKYYFGDKGTATQNGVESYRTYSTNHITNTTWYLHTIKSVDSTNQIDLHYEEERFDFESPGSCINIPNNILMNSYPLNCSGPIMTFQTGKRLTQIVATNQTVNFIANTNRIDIFAGTAKRLDAIEIEQGNATYCKRFDFSYSYFQDTSPNSHPAANSYLNHRLRLNSIQERNCFSNIDIPPYTFSYNASAAYGDNYLPNRLSNAIDHWGFYNEALSNNANAFNIPYTKVSIPDDLLVTAPTGVHSMGSSDRESDEAAMLVGTINKITYPTGGHTEFTFEANDYYTTVDTVENLLLNIQAFCQANPFTGVVTFETEDLSHLKYALNIDPGPCVPSGFIPDEVNIAVLIGQNQLDEVTYTYDATNPPSPSAEALTELFSGIEFQVGTNYTFKITSPFAFTNFKVYGRATHIQGNKKVGGLRIKEIRQYDGISVSKDIIKTYNYTRPNDSRSSGHLYKMPVYGSYLTLSKFCVPAEPGCGCLDDGVNGCPLTGPPCEQGGSDCQTYIYNYQYDGNPLIDNNFIASSGINLTFFDNSIVPLGSFEGHHIYYDRVVEDQNGNGTVEYNYYTEDPYYPDEYQYPIPPPQYRALEGKKLSQITKDESENTISIQNNLPKNDTYEYSTENIYKVTIGSGGRSLLTKYQIRTRPYRLEKVTYSSDGVVSEKTFTYDDTKPHLQPTKQRTTNSNNKIHETNYKYYDEITNTSIKTWLQTNNIIEPWETTNYVYDNATDTSPTQIDGTSISYDNFNTTGDNLVYYPKTFKRYEVSWNQDGTINDEGWQTQYTINNYNTSLGKPKEIKVEGWTDPTTYTWTSTGKLDTKTYKDFVTDYNYHTNTDLLSEIIEPDGQKTTFTYDDFMRLDEISSRGGKVKKEYSYSYTPNFVQETSTFDDTGTTNDITNIVKTSFDGLGREIKIDQVNHKWNNPTTDISVLKEYNNQGLLWKVYEPDDNTTATGDNYTEYTYHPDPLGRIKSIKDPMGFTSTNSYDTNIASEVVNYNNYSADETKYYTANTLYKETTTDPDGNHSSTFTDKLGRVIMTMNSNVGDTKTNKTYTNYDDKSRVITIIPPGATPNDAGLIYQYTYDGADNVLTTKLPDKGLMEYRYNARNLQTAMQDANLKANNKWLRSSYDLYGRLHQQGFSAAHNGAISDLLIHNYYDNNDTKDAVNTATKIYTGQLHKTKVNILNGFNAGADYLTTSFTLDNYGRISKEKINKENTTTNHIGMAESVDYKYDMADNILENKHTVGSTISTETFQFDNKGRLQSNNFSLSGKGIKTIANYASYSLKDEVLQKNIGSAAFNSYLQTVDYQYNANGWLTKINEGAVSGTNSNCASITGISRNDLFALDIRYDDASLTGSVGRKNGNIAEIYWQTAERAKNAYRFKYDYLNRLTEAKHYKNAVYEGNYDSSYSYDERGNINTLTRNGLTGNGTSCTEKQIDNLTYLYTDGTNKLSKVFDCVSQYDHEHINPIDKEIYVKKSISSDAKTNTPGENSNTKSIKFIAGIHISLQPGFEYTNKNNGEFSATISPSFCLSNSDLANHGFKGEESSYRYDANGNLSRDSQKQVSILYNHLNLPYQVTKNGGDKIEWLYTANGQKLQKKVTLSGTPSIKNYLGNMEFTQSGNTNTLEAAYHSEGRVLNNGTWEYNLKDHLGNVRIVFVEGVDRSGKIVQENHYYPFGMQQNGNWQNNQSVKNDYLYNGKELNTEIELNWSDYGFRHYDAAIGRFTGVDPLAAKYAGWSPYNYVMGNPIRYIDPDGREVVIPTTETGSNRRKIMRTLRKLTNDRLAYNKTTGQVTVRKSRTGNRPKGSLLIKNLIGDSHTNTIRVVKGGGNLANPTSWSGHLGAGGSGADIKFDPTSKPKIPTEYPKTGNVSGKGRPNHIGQGHELIHADHFNSGNVDPSPTTHTYKDATGKTVTQTARSEEFRTIGLKGARTGDITENDLRKETRRTRKKKRGAY